MAEDGKAQEPPTGEESQESTDAEVLDSALEGLPPEQRAILLEVVTKSSGPLPPAEQFAMYEAASPGAGPAILKGYEETRRHRFAMDRKLANTARLSLVLTWSIVIGVLVLAAFFGATGKQWLAGLFGAGGLVPVLIALIRGGGDWSGHGDQK